VTQARLQRLADSRHVGHDRYRRAVAHRLGNSKHRASARHEYPLIGLDHRCDEIADRLLFSPLHIDALVERRLAA
jgi:hypothetical protein